MSYVNQIIGSIVISSLCFNLGIVFTWPSGTINLFTSNNTRLDRPMSEYEVNCLGSFSSLAPLIGTPLTGYFMDVIGRKNVAVITSVVPVICWILVALMDKVDVILASMFIGGLGGGAVVLVPVYIGEICQESIRGTMVSCTTIFYAVGMMVSYLLADLPYNIVIYCNLSLAALGVIGIIAIVEETPVYLLKKGFQEEAIKNIAHYRKVKINSKEVSSELEVLHRALNPGIELQSLSPEQEKLNLEQKDDPKKKASLWQFFKNSPTTQRALIITLVMMASIFQGLPAVLVYGGNLYTKAMTSMQGTVLMAFVTIVFNTLGGILADIVGRKPLMMHSSFISGVMCVLIGTQLEFEWAAHWVTVLMINIYAMVFSLGSGTVPYVLISELFLPEVSSMMSMIAIEFGWVATFLVVFIYQPFEIYVGVGRVFYLFSGFGFLSAIYTMFYLPETKGLTVDAIQIVLNKRIRTKGSNKPTSK